MYSLLLSIFILFYGVQIFKTWWQLHRAGELIPSNMLYPKDCSEKDCKDPEGFFQYVKPRYLALSVFCLVYGVVRLFLEYTGLIDSNSAPAMIVAVIFIVIVFVASLRISNGGKKYFGL